MCKLIDSLEKGNFYKEYEKAGNEAYKRSWKERPVSNVLSIIWGVFYRFLLAFGVFSCAFIFWFALFSYESNGVMQTINYLKEIINEIKSPNDLKNLVNFWVYSSLYIFMILLFFKPVKTTAKKEREYHETMFMGAYGKYIPSTFLKPIDEELSGSKKGGDV